jgi:hypothetical protein
MKEFLAFLFCCLFCVSAFSQSADKLDEFVNIPCDDYLGRMDAAMNKASENPSSTVYVLIYEGKEFRYNNRKKKTELVFPGFGSAKAKISSMKRYISLRSFPVERFKFVKAGFRENSTVEMWLVPSGGNQPKSTPTLTKMKYRKGKATGFCWWCCD